MCVNVRAYITPNCSTHHTTIIINYVVIRMQLKKPCRIALICIVKSFGMYRRHLKKKKKRKRKNNRKDKMTRILCTDRSDI